MYEGKERIVAEVLTPLGARFAAGERFRPTTFYDSITFNHLWTRVQPQT
jgi:hypothetical protein